LHVSVFTLKYPHAGRAINHRSQQRFVVQAVRNFHYSPGVQMRIEDFLQFLRHERGQSGSV
jgi:hypothetical protein